MAKQSQNKTISLSPSWKNHIIGYAISVLLIPLFGIGLAILYWIWKRQNKYSYQFSDTQISSQDNKYARNIDLVNIDKVEIEQSWIQQKMEVGDIILSTSASSMTLRGMEHPQNLKEVLEKAIYAERERQKQQERNSTEMPDHKPGSKNKMNYLTGLWQQGLVSNEDFDEERKHFE